MRPTQPPKPPTRVERLSRSRRMAAVLAALVALGASLVTAPIAAASSSDGPITVAIATAPPPPPPRPPTPPPGGPRYPDGRRWEPCRPVFGCVEIARQVCRALRGCKTPGERWRATRRNAPQFENQTAADGEPLPGVRAQWQLHHIIPIHDRYSYVAQSIAWKVGIKPNDGVNGVWLRGPKLARGTPAYDALPANSPLRRRIYHPSLSGPRNRAHYARLVNKRLLSACPGQRCTRARVDEALRGLRGGLIRGNPGFYRPGVPRR